MSAARETDKVLASASGPHDLALATSYLLGFLSGRLDDTGQLTQKDWAAALAATRRDMARRGEADRS